MTAAVIGIAAVVVLLSVAGIIGLAARAASRPADEWDVWADPKDQP